MAIETGHSFGRYRMQRLLGQGGFANVYLAVDPALERWVAIKVLHADLAADPRLSARFQAEGQQLARMRHPNIVGVHDVGAEDGRPYLAMDYLEGVTLSTLLDRRGAFALNEVARVASQLGSALDYLHGIGIIHRDLKPSNIMVDDVGHVTLMDFGISRELDRPGMTTMGGILGTPRYMSPEQVRGSTVEAAADIYALAVVCYELLAGQPPFTGDALSLMHQQAWELPPPLASRRADLPPRVCATIDAGLLKDPRQRPSTAGLLATELAAGAWQADDSPSWPPATVSQTPVGVPPMHPRSRPPAAARSPLPYILAVAGAAVIMGAIIALGLVASGSGNSGKGVSAAAASVSPSATPGPPPTSSAFEPTSSPSPALAGSVTPVTAVATVRPATATASPTRPPTPPPTPSPMTPEGDYRLVQNVGSDRCLHGRSAPGTGQPIYYCVADGFVARAVDGPVSASGYQWYNVDGLGWMAERDPAGGTVWLASVAQPPPPEAGPLKALQTCGPVAISFTTSIRGSVTAPSVLRSSVHFSGVAFTADDGTFAGWVYGHSIYLKYQTSLNGARATGTIVGSFTSASGFDGSFVSTAFADGTGSYGSVSGQAGGCNRG